MTHTLSLSPAAAAHIQDILARHSNAVGFRLSVKKTGCSGYMYDPAVTTFPNPSDLHLQLEGGVNVYVDADWLPVLQGLHIDLEVGQLGQKKLQYHNPNVDDECGCGESFHIPDSSPDSQEGV